MFFRRKNGFALPTILIASIIMLTVLLASVVSISAMQSSLNSQYYDKLSRSAGDAGLVYAEACIKQNNGNSWASPLKHDTDCSGAQLASCPIVPADADCHFVLLDDNIRTTFSVAATEFDGAGKVIGVSSTGTINLVRNSDGTTWRTYNNVVGFLSPLVSSSPVWSQFDGGGEHMCGIKAADKMAYCWGAAWLGQIGDNNPATSSRLYPTAAYMGGVLSGKYIKQITAGYEHTCVIASDDKAYCWGLNDFGQLGNDNAPNNSIFPVAVNTAGVLNGKTITGIAAGTKYTCALTSEGKVYCWGKNGQGQLGNGLGVDTDIPVAVSTTGVLSGKTIQSISAGFEYACAIDTANAAYCWGQGWYGRLGNGLTSNALSPVSVSMVGPLAGKTIKLIAPGYFHTCAIASDDLGYCWGFNEYGDLGNNTTSPQSLTPLAVSMTGPLAGKTLKYLSVQSYHTCAIASDDLVYCWGYNEGGELGQYTTSVAPQPPTAVYAGVGNGLNGKLIQLLTTGDYVNCVLASDNLSYCWGYNAHGGYGNGTIDSFTYPVSGINL